MTSKPAFPPIPPEPPKMVPIERQEPPRTIIATLRIPVKFLVEIPTNTYLDIGNGGTLFGQMGSSVLYSMEDAARRGLINIIERL